MGASVLRLPNSSVNFVDDGGLRDPYQFEPSLSDFFISKAQRYLGLGDGRSSLFEVMNSRWPILAILGQIAGTRMLFSPGNSYWRPFLFGGGPPAIVEAGAHDG